MELYYPVVVDVPPSTLALSLRPLYRVVLVRRENRDPLELLASRFAFFFLICQKSHVYRIFHICLY